MKKTAIVIILFIMAAVFTGGASAQGYYSAKDADQFFPDFKSDEDMSVATALRTPTRSAVQFGGWIMPTFLTDYRGGSNQLNSSITNINVWLKANLWENAYIYLRGRDTLTGIMKQKGYGGLDEIDNLIDLDLGYISSSFLDGMLRLQFGRKYFTAGAGLVLNGRGDGIQFDINTRWFRFGVYGMYTGLIQKENNLYQISSKDYSDGSKRIFTGGELAFPFENQEAYILAVGQFDMSEETAGARNKYNSQYCGGGLRGIISDAVTYYGEFIYETGTTFDSDNKKHDIRAMAASFSMDYYINVATFPTFVVQYNYASGDTSRENYSNSLTGAGGGNDTGFIGFGTFSAGFALRPLPGNLHAVRAGFSISPFSWAKQFYLKRITLLAKYSCYLKDKTEGIIGQGEAALDELLVGHGVDVSLRWKILGDLSLFVNYGVFLPGDAYASSENDRHFVMEGISLSF